MIYYYLRLRKRHATLAQLLAEPAPHPLPVRKAAVLHFYLEQGFFALSTLVVLPLSFSLLLRRRAKRARPPPQTKTAILLLLALAKLNQELSRAFAQYFYWPFVRQAALAARGLGPPLPL